MFEGLKVLVVGDLCLDIIEEGISTRLAPEAPVPVILNPTTTYTLGMAGNTALNLKYLGADVYIASHIGIESKPETKKIFELLDKNEIKYVKRVYNSTDNNIATVKKRIFANNKQVARIDEENSLENSRAFNSAINRQDYVYEQDFFDFIVISDYNKGYINKNNWESFLSQLYHYNKGDFFVDTKKLNVLDFYEGMYIFPNSKEMKELMEFNNCTTRNEFRLEMDLDFLVETASELGAYIYEEEKVTNHQVYKSNVVDVYGCGDTFVAAFSLYYTKFKDKYKAADFANYCCSKVIQKKGTTPIDFREVSDYFGRKQ